jgi:mRNA-degrading endonuclease RelE of RelBE toxin-antitoxin system
MYEIVFSAPYDRYYRKLTPELQRQTDAAVQQLRLDPRHPSLHTHKRKGQTNIWQARVTRTHRLFFLLENDVITLLSVEPHEK